MTDPLADPFAPYCPECGAMHCDWNAKRASAKTLPELTMSMFASVHDLATAQGERIRELEAQGHAMAAYLHEYVRLASSQAVADDDWEEQIRTTRDLLGLFGR